MKDSGRCLRQSNKHVTGTTFLGFPIVAFIRISRDQPIEIISCLTDNLTEEAKEEADYSKY
jgi:hypothetical protein